MNPDKPRSFVDRPCHAGAPPAGVPLRPQSPTDPRKIGDCAGPIQGLGVHRHRLVKDGLIEETTDRVRRDDSERRRYYTLTADGRAVAVAELGRLQSMVHRIAAHLPGGANA